MHLGIKNFIGGPTGTLFGDGTYSGNIIQDGEVLQPQDYLLDGITPLAKCIVVTGAATVTPDATTGASVYMAHNLALVGASASLSASTRCKGLLGFVNGLVVLRDGAHLHMDRLGKAGNFGDISPDMLLPAALARRIAIRKLKAYVVKGRGAEGGAETAHVSGLIGATGNAGHAAGPMQTGGGGTGYANMANASGIGWAGAAGCGGPCCGGAASGSNYGVKGGTAAAGAFGGPASNPVCDFGVAGQGVGGSAGEPPSLCIGAGVYTNPAAGGGLTILFAATFASGAGCTVSADGSNGGYTTATYTIPGAAAGGGCVVIVTKPGRYTNQGSVRATGGVSGHMGRFNSLAGPGGAGSVNIFELAA